MTCRCHTQKCGRCFGCSRCTRKCPPVRRNKRNRRSGPVYSESEEEEETNDCNVNDGSKVVRTDLPVDSRPKIKRAFCMRTTVRKEMPNFNDLMEKEMSESYGRKYIDPFKNDNV